MAGTKFDARMTVLRLSSGELMLHSPCDITTAMADKISALGPVAHIVVPGNFHHMYAATAQAAFPNAKTWICPGIERRRPGLKYDGALGDVPWQGAGERQATETVAAREVVAGGSDKALLLSDTLIEPGVELEVEPAEGEAGQILNPKS